MGSSLRGRVCVCSHALDRIVGFPDPWLQVLRFAVTLVGRACILCWRLVHTGGLSLGLFLGSSAFAMGSPC